MHQLHNYKLPFSLFDTVDHQILLDKLERNYGIRGLALQLMESYLSNRQQYTKIHPYKSKLEKSHVESLKARPWVPFFSYCTLMTFH